MIDRPDNGTNTGLFGQWGTPAPGGNMGADTPGPTQPALFNFFPVVEEVGFLFRRLVRRNYLGAPPGRSSNHGAKGATTDETESGLFQGVPTTTCCDPI